MSEAPRLNQHQEASPVTISGPEGDITVYNVSTDFRGLDKAHKKSFVPKTEPESAYVSLVPDVGNIRMPHEVALGTQQREQIINSGTIPEVMPFMAGVRIALAERRAERQQGRAKSALRSAHVAHNIAAGVVHGKSYSEPENEFRPRTLQETAIAKRAGRLIRRANAHNSAANVIEGIRASEDRIPTLKKNLSVFEKLHRRSEKRQHTMRREQSDKLIHGQRIPLTGKKIGLLSFDRLVGSRKTGNHIEKAEKALEKRDNAIRLAEALRRHT